MPLSRTGAIWQTISRTTEFIATGTRGRESQRVVPQQTCKVDHCFRFGSLHCTGSVPRLKSSNLFDLQLPANAFVVPQ
jgi:hypothetical protein